MNLRLASCVFSTRNLGNCGRAETCAAIVESSDVSDVLVQPLVVTRCTESTVAL